jgi:hypothetical protein
MIIVFQGAKIVKRWEETSRKGVEGVEGVKGVEGRGVVNI